VKLIHSRFFPGAKGILRYDIFYLLILLVTFVIFWSVLGVSDLVERGKIQQFDEKLLLSVRQPDDLMQLRGPAWLGDFMRDITALGGAPVLTLITFGVVGYLILQKSYRSLWLVIIATISGFLISLMLKFYFIRPRPEIVPHLMTEITPSFPSGHSMMSAVIYLTLAALLTRLETSNRVRIYTISIAFFVVFLIGISRVFLGVHYPTDILGGWTFGLIWAMICWYVARYLQLRGSIEEPAQELT
jgi:undecaprenyl-diphosphatase